MGILRLLTLPFRLVAAAVKLVLGTLVGWVVVNGALATGKLPPDPLGLAGMGAPETMFGIPTTYVGAIVLFDLLLVFGGGSGSGSVGGGGGFGGDGGGDGGGGGE